MAVNNNLLVDDCIFCKIIRKEIPSYKIFENDDVYAFLDISQVTPGHTLLIPKKHIENIFDYTQEDAAKYLQYLPIVANAIKASDKKIIGMNIQNNNGKYAGQVVMHSHFHLIPRRLDDGLKIPTRNNASKYTTADYERIAKKIRENVQSN